MNHKTKSNLTASEIETVKQIAVRAGKFFKTIEPLQIIAYVTGVHQLIPLRLQALLDSDDVNFTHDIGGILKSYNMRADKLENHFIPKFSETGYLTAVINWTVDSAGLAESEVKLQIDLQNDMTCLSAYVIGDCEPDDGFEYDRNFTVEAKIQTNLDKTQLLEAFEKRNAFIGFNVEKVY
jgi:hypothetical protein